MALAEMFHGGCDCGGGSGGGDMMVYSKFMLLNPVYCTSDRQKLVTLVNGLVYWPIGVNVCFVGVTDG